MTRTVVVALIAAVPGRLAATRGRGAPCDGPSWPKTPVSSELSQGGPGGGPGAPSAPVAIHFSNASLIRATSHCRRGV